MPTSESFRNHWAFVQAMTLDFARCVPDERWDFSPHEGFAPFAKQLRHVVCVRGVYMNALASGKADWSRKHEHYSGGLARAELVAALIEKHETMLATLAAPDESAPIESFGKQFPLAGFFHVIVQHEAIHQGQWSVYAALAGFETPLLWRTEWAL